jgi:hypothetical protein
MLKRWPEWLSRSYLLLVGMFNPGGEDIGIRPEEVPNNRSLLSTACSCQGGLTNRFIPNTKRPNFASCASPPWQFDKFDTVMKSTNCKWFVPMELYLSWSKNDVCTHTSVELLSEYWKVDLSRLEWLDSTWTRKAKSKSSQSATCRDFPSRNSTFQVTATLNQLNTLNQ